MATDVVERNRRTLWLDLMVAKQDMNLVPSSGLDANYWISAVAICTLLIDLSKAQLQLAKREEAKLQLKIKTWEEGSDPAIRISWIEEERRRVDLDIRRLMERITATTYEKKLYKIYAETIQKGEQTNTKELQARWALEDGAISIVPGLAGNPTAEQIAEWEAKDDKEYRRSIIDTAAECLDNDIHWSSGCSTPIQEFDGKRIIFRGDLIRPNPRYLYFHYAMAQLKLIWRYQQDPTSPAPKPMLGTGWWVTRYRYLNPGLLFVIANEIARITGEDPKHVALPSLDGNTIRPGEEGLMAMIKMIQAQRTKQEFRDEEDEEEYRYLDSDSE